MTFPGPRDSSLEARLRIVLEALEASQSEIRSVIEQLQDKETGNAPTAPQ